MKKIALIYGITGQDGSYLAELLIKKKYIVHGVIRRSSSFNTARIDHLYTDRHKSRPKMILHYGDITDSLSVSKLINKIKPDEIYNLAAQSHVAVSFESPEYTANADALGPLRILESIRLGGLKKKIKFYQAGTSEMFGDVLKSKQDENTPFNPVSPYGSAKVYGHWITKVYRNAYGIFASNGILFNHESPRRGNTFVTKKIIRALCKIKLGSKEKLFLGNIYTKRDWGHAKDYCEAMWKILNYKKPDDFIIATGKQYTVKSFINKTCQKLSLKIKWIGKGENEKAVNLKNNNIIIQIDPKYFRPLEVKSLLGNYSKSRKLLKWKPKCNIDDLISDMINSEMNYLSKK
jgi:GDPmannose 4,6-dehydratase